MEGRQRDLIELNSYVENIDKELTMILQSLQWDRKHLLESTTLLPCKFDANHRMPPDSIELHEKECFLKLQGYTNEDRLLPDTLDPGAPTVVKLNSEQIKQIINNEAQLDVLFKRGPGKEEGVPLTAGRLQVAFSSDERRAIHDAVVAAAPSLHEITDFTLPGSSNEGVNRRKSKMEVLAELRNMHRRRAKYRTTSAASKNYSHVLKDLIKTQMEYYGGPDIKETPVSKTNNTHTIQSQQRDKSYHTNASLSTKIKIEQTSEDEREKFKENTSDRRKKEYNKYKERHRYREDRDRDTRTKYQDCRRDYKNERNSVFVKEEGRDYSARGGKEKYRDKRDNQRRSEYSSRDNRNRYDSEERGESSYRSDKYYSSDSREKTRHRDRETDPPEKSSEQKYKRYYDTLSESEASYKNAKRKRHS